LLRLISLNNWLVPLNLHHSLKLRTLAKNSQELNNISHSLYSLTNSILTLEQSSIELTGTTNAILDLLQSEQHKQQAIAVMRSLIFNHLNACESAFIEKDYLTAYSSCVISNRMLNQPWFDQNLFSYASFEEMKYASDSLARCQEIMIGIWSKLDEGEKSMITLFIDSLDELDDLKKQEIDAVNSFSEINFKIGVWPTDAGLIKRKKEIRFRFRDVDSKYVLSWDMLPISKLGPHPIHSTKYSGNAFRSNNNPDGYGDKYAHWVLADYSADGISEWKDLDRYTHDDWRIFLRSIQLRSNNPSGGTVPQELIDWIEKPLSPGKGVFRRGYWAEDSRRSSQRAANVINNFYNKYITWKEASIRDIDRREEILKTCNNSFNGRLEIQS
jgi:hypothetical protein